MGTTVGNSSFAPAPAFCLKFQLRCRWALSTETSSSLLTFAIAKYSAVIPRSSVANYYKCLLLCIVSLNNKKIMKE